MKVTVKKLFDGKVSLRDYIVWKAVNRNQSVTVHFNDESMTLTPEQLAEDGKTTEEAFPSRWGNFEYHLIDYEWKPDKQQTKLF